MLPFNELHSVQRRSTELCQYDGLSMTTHIMTPVKLDADWLSKPELPTKATKVSIATAYEDGRHRQTG